MIFEILYESMKRNELILVEGGLCNWHLRRDGQLTIREVLVLTKYQRRGVGKSMIDKLKHVQGATSIFAKCPADITANSWYQHMGFLCEGTEITKTGRKIKLWRLRL